MIVIQGTKKTQFFISVIKGDAFAGSVIHSFTYTFWKRSVSALTKNLFFNLMSIIPALPAASYLDEGVVIISIRSTADDGKVQWRCSKQKQEKLLGM